jgi:hypothetical protein
MKKAIFTLNINNYSPEVCSMTYPLMQHWADKIGADFREITERKFPEWPVVYEKFQLRDLGAGYDWTIFLDADTLWYPDSPDWTELVSKDTVLNYGKDFAPIRATVDNYFRRDGRGIGTAGWCTLCSDWTREDLYTPLGIPYDEALRRLHPTVKEYQIGMEPGHLIDDYVMSLNVARFGLKYDTIIDFGGKRGFGQTAFHNYFFSLEDKIKVMKLILGGEKALTDGGFSDGEIARLKGMIMTGPDAAAPYPGWQIPSALINRRVMNAPASIAEVLSARQG